MPETPLLAEQQFGLYGSPDAPRRQIPAWVMSCLLHAVLMLVFAFLVRDVTRGAAPESVRTAGIVLTRQTAGDLQYFSESDRDAADSSAADSSSTAASPAAPDELLASLPAPADLPFDATGVLPASDSVRTGGAGDWAAALPSAAELTAGLGPSKSLGDGTKTYVFGVAGEGSLFVYLFDRSSSMSGFGGRPLAAAKSELINSLHSLQPTDQFQIIFYNHEFTAFNPTVAAVPGLIFATENNLSLAERFVQGIAASGGTEHVAPLRLALRLAPDVIFFLTDAEDPQLSDVELQRLRRLNKGAAIHAIEFGFGPRRGGDNFLSKLARQNNGQHVYVDVTRLTDRPE